MTRIGMVDLHEFKPLSVCETKGGVPNYTMRQALGARE